AAVAGGRDRMLREEGLRIRFRALEPRRRRARPEAAQPGRIETIHDAGDERLLGPDDRERDRFALRERDEAVEIVRTDRDVSHPRLARRSRVTRRDQHLGDERRLGGLPSDRVLAPAGADDEYLHVRLARIIRGMLDEIARTRIERWPPSVAEVPHAGEYHRDAVLVRRVDHLGIAN